ncbi:hypothetical protein BDN70DRAFT_817038, partial [Pholiota conissans]
IDVQSVHRSAYSRAWMKANHPFLILDFVPGGCSSVHYPCDVDIQQPLKLSMQKPYHEDIVGEFVTQINDGSAVLSVNDTLRVLRDRIIQWMWSAFTVSKNRDLVKKVSRGEASE